MVEGKGFVWRVPHHLAQMHATAWTSRGPPCPTMAMTRNRRNPAQPRERAMRAPGGWGDCHPRRRRGWGPTRKFED
jgi:hypothetical protein